MILIGSRAAQHWIPAFRAPDDWDVIATLDEVRDLAARLGDRLVSLVPSAETKLDARLACGTRLEIELAETIPSSARLHRMAHPACVDVFGAGAHVPSPTVLYVLKRSHIHRPIHWRKNIDDLHSLKPLADAEPAAELLELLRERRAETDARAPMRVPSLAMSNSDFFRQSRIAVKQIYPHDAYHWAIAYEDRPMFSRLKRERGSARCERHLFDAMSEIQRLRCVREETMAIALERYIVPGQLTDAAEAYLAALERVSTTLTSGWFREFAIDNYPLLKTPDIDYVARFRERLAWALTQAEISLREAA